ncbi:DUF7336 domain-containing protein [Metapseudomonas otitidis]|uniref:DUF7336 domain-containing protein n=1 Tax=Metapseudomonas otitidis TaxID=319939 RepID=UPI0013F65273|nr:hypothetical protein [Pseudomonas otitidis]
MKDVFILHHTYGDSNSESYKLLGIFRSRQKANSKIREYAKLPGFIDFPDGFTVTRYTLDESHWLDGFGSEKLDEIEDKN